MMMRWTDTHVRAWEVISAVALVGLLWACAGPKAVVSPEWVLREPLAYPTSHYLVGVGSAPTRGGVPAAQEAASASARAQIGQTIEVRVEHVVESLVEMTTTGERSVGKLNWALETERSSLSSFTRTSTSQMVRGIELKEKYLDERMGILYVLAVLDKAQAAGRLTAEATELDAEAVLLRNRARAHEVDGEILTAVQTLRLALKASLEADLLYCGDNGGPPDRSRGEEDAQLFSTSFSENIGVSVKTPVSFLQELHNDLSDRCPRSRLVP